MPVLGGRQPRLIHQQVEFRVETLVLELEMLEPG
jgi:hypothetical protein